MSIAVIDYGAGNLRSVIRALQRIGAPLEVTSNPYVVIDAPAVILPGVGATRDTMQNLERLGLAAAIRDVIARGTPFLGICVGMQVLCEQSEEFGLTMAVTSILSIRTTAIRQTSTMLLRLPGTASLFRVRSFATIWQRCSSIPKRVVAADCNC